MKARNLIWLLAGWMGACWAGPACGQTAFWGGVAPAVGGDAADPGGMFNRFSGKDSLRDNWQIELDVPVALRPQVEPGATVVENTGFQYVLSHRPQDRVYISNAFEAARVSWAPRDPNIEKIQLVQFQVSQLINLWAWRVAVVRIGLGVGFMDGLIRYNDHRDFQTRLEPYIPIQFGLGFHPVGHWTISFKGSWSLFYGPGPVISHTRGLVGLGYGY